MPSRLQCLRSLFTSSATLCSAAAHRRGLTIPALQPSAGSWVAWKQPGDKAAAGGDLFVSGSFYNLLCPQRPMTV